MVDIVYAMGAGGGGAGGGEGAGAMLFPMLIMFGIFYLLLIRPQQKKQKQHQEMINELKKGDRIMTNGGIYGRITSSDGPKLTIEVADNVKIKVNRGYVAGLEKQTPAPAPTKKEKDKDKGKETTD